MGLDTTDKPVAKPTTARRTAVAGAADKARAEAKKENNRAGFNEAVAAQRKARDEGVGKLLKIVKADNKLTDAEVDRSLQKASNDSLWTMTGQQAANWGRKYNFNPETQKFQALLGKSKVLVNKKVLHDKKGLVLYNQNLFKKEFLKGKRELSKDEVAQRWNELNGVTQLRNARAARNATRTKRT